MDKRKRKADIARPDHVISYFYVEWGTLLLITVSGIIYNVGLLAGPWFEGQLAQCLLEIFGRSKDFRDMLQLAISYVAVIAAVQFARYVKRLYVRRFANNVNRSMKSILYGNLVHKSKAELERENVGNVMTKAISDVDACVEGMRKFTTEIFDTGIALVCYAGLLLWYDWRLALLCLIFPPFSYLIAEKMKTVVQKSGAAYKESAGRLSAATLDRTAGAVTYRVHGCEQQQNGAYEAHLDDYEKKAIRANIWVSAMPPLYHVISMVSVLFILYFGARNVSGEGWSVWDIAAFTTFLSCYTKMSVKSSKAAKLFNSVQKAEVSWKRIRPLMKAVIEDAAVECRQAAFLSVKNLSFAYPGGEAVFTNLSFEAGSGQVIGVTGPVACGKSTLGRSFLCEFPYGGSIRLDGKELAELPAAVRSGLVGYLGHDPELMSDTVKNNILMGDDEEEAEYLHAVCLEREVAEMPEGADTMVGDSGIRLSGGQQARLALARTLAHIRPLLILDDPFSALDAQTEKAVFENLKRMAGDSIVLLISHRLTLFPGMDRVIWMDDGKTEVKTHAELLRDNPQYANLYRLQCEGRDSR